MIASQAEVEIPRTLAIIVPVLNELEGLPSLVQHLDQVGAEQIIIVDGGSVDGGLAWLRNSWEDRDSGRIAMQSAPGRARQMNAGVWLASCDILLFLHSDSRLPLNAKRQILAARERQSIWGRFDIEFQTKPNLRPVMWVIALFINIRSRLSSIATGDQAIFVDYEVFRAVGGYPQIPLMEDVALSKTLKRYGVPHCSSLRVSTSARRWEQGGVVKTVLLMWYFRLAYFCGISPQRLAKQYRHIR